MRDDDLDDKISGDWVVAMKAEVSRLTRRLADAHDEITDLEDALADARAEIARLTRTGDR